MRVFRPAKHNSNFSLPQTESITPPPVIRPPSPPRTPVKAPPSPPPVTHQKPPYSFSCLIFMAIEAAPARALPVKEIYAWIIRHFPYFRHAPQGWKNSVRHNLSLNKCFHKVSCVFWCDVKFYHRFKFYTSQVISQAHHYYLARKSKQFQPKAKIHLKKIERLHGLISDSDGTINYSRCKTTIAKLCRYVRYPSNRRQALLKCCIFQVAAAPGLGKGSLWTVDPQHRASLLQVIVIQLLIIAI